MADGHAPIGRPAISTVEFIGVLQVAEAHRFEHCDGSLVAWIDVCEGSQARMAFHDRAEDGFRSKAVSLMLAEQEHADLVGLADRARAYDLAFRFDEIPCAVGLQTRTKRTCERQEGIER